MFSGSASAQSLVNGGSIAGSISTVGGQDSYTFTASVGEGYQLRVADVNASSLYPRLTVFAPGGAVVAARSGPDVAAYAAIAATTGTYTVIVDDGNSTPQTGAYVVHFTRAPGANEGGALVNGGAASSSITIGDLDSYTFAIQANEGYHLRFADLAGGLLYPAMSLYSPTGALVSSRSGPDVAVISGAATMTGTYTVVLGDGNSNPRGTGNYELHFTRAPGANEGGLLSNGGLASDTITVGDLDSYTFTIQANQGYHLRFADLSAGRLYPSMALYDPTGALVSSRSGPDVAVIAGAATWTGTYTVVLTDGNSNPNGTGRYELHFGAVPGANEGGALANGGFAAGAITVGDLDSYTFVMQANERYQLRFADLLGGSLYPLMSVYGPTGALLETRSGPDVAAIHAAAPTTGTYTVLLADGNSNPNGAGAYELHFTRAPGANEGGLLVSGASRSGSITVGDLDSYTFTAAPGEKYQLRFADVNGGPLYPAMWLYGPTGALLASTSSPDVAVIGGSAPVMGTYTVVLADGNSNPSRTGPYELYFVSGLGGGHIGPLVNGGAVSGAIVRGSLDSYSFTANAGEGYRIQFADIGQTALYPSLTIYDPAGALVVTRSSPLVAVYSGVAGLSGTYTAFVTDGNSTPDATGAYEVHYARAPGANEGGALSDRVTVTGTIDFGDVDSFTFAGSAGKTARITLEDTVVGSLYPTMTLYGPSGDPIVTAAHPTTASIVRQLTATGTYTLVVHDGNSAANGTGPYALTVDAEGAVPGSGCPGEAPPSCLVPPSASTGFTIACPTLNVSCLSQTLLMFGGCASSPLAVPPPIGCGTCGLLVLPSWGTVAGQLVIPPMPVSAVGFSFCVQCGCISAGCIGLSAGARVVVVQ